MVGMTNGSKELLRKITVIPNLFFRKHQIAKLLEGIF